MTLLAEDLLGRNLVFVLAQKPHGLDGDVRIATLLPIMDFDSGGSLGNAHSTFPSHGYVRWFRVPNGVWNDGEIVIGELRKNEHNGYGVPDKEWYQVYADSGKRATGRVCELMPISASSDELQSVLYQPMNLERAPTGEFYLICKDAIAGPCRAGAIDQSGRELHFVEPSDSVEGEIHIYDRTAFENASITVTRIGAILSANEFPPADTRNAIYRTNIQVFRKQDLDNAGLEKQTRYLLSSEQLVAKICKQVRIGKKWTTLRDELKPLVAELDQNSVRVSQAVVEGLPRLLADTNLRVELQEQLVDALTDDARFGQLISEGINKKIDEGAQLRAGDIETEAKRLAVPKLAEVDSVSQQIEALNAEKTTAKAELAKIEEARLESEIRAQEVMDGVNKKLESSRNELLGELALFVPLFHPSSTVSTSGNGNVPVESIKSKPEQPVQQTRFNLEPLPVGLSSPKLDERVFVENRLWPCLLAQGCSVSSRDAEFFHAVMVVSGIVGIPHPGWAVAYAEAMSETASVQILSASPDWLSFDSVFRGVLADTWHFAIRDSQRLHLIVIEGIDRCPSHAWLRPWININAGWSTHLPDANQSVWPDNIRLCVTQEQSESCFELTKELRQWIIEFDAKPVDTEPTEVVDGHFPLDSWRQDGIADADELFDGFVKSLNIPAAKPFTKSRTQLACRLRSTLMRLNEEDAARCEAIIGKRLFSCWSDEEAK